MQTKPPPPAGRKLKITIDQWALFRQHYYVTAKVDGKELYFERVRSYYETKDIVRKMVEEAEEAGITDIEFDGDSGMIFAYHHQGD